ncbi:MAG: CBS domain-containing protein [Bacteroidetes bacterium]|nr:CBS domain-containing protein [Bacteroidota bacterium]
MPKFESDFDMDFNMDDFEFTEVRLFNDPSYYLSHLIPEGNELISIHPDMPIQEAITKLISYDYSQLPVLTHQTRGLVGVISWKSLGQKFSLMNGNSKVKDLAFAPSVVFKETTPLFTAVPEIIRNDFVLVENNAKEIIGIVTAADLSSLFLSQTKPFLIIGEIESYLRDILGKLSISTLKAIAVSNDNKREINTVNDLSFGEYQRLFENEENWNKLNLQFDKKYFCGLMNTCRAIRNKTMHFDPQGLLEEDMNQLMKLLNLLKNLKDRGYFNI